MATSTLLKAKWRSLFVCWVLGMGSAMSWSSMLTIADYYYEIFPRYHPARVLTLVYQPCTVGTMAVLTYFAARINPRTRNIVGFALSAVCLFSCILLDLATCGKGGVVPYVGLCFLYAMFGIANAHVTGGMVGELSSLSPDFMQAFFAGFGASGFLTSVLRLATKAAFENSHNGLRKGAYLFLGLSTAIDITCIFLYVFYFSRMVPVAAKNKDELIDEENCLNMKQLFYSNWDYHMDLFLIYVLTLSIFPGFLYENTGKHTLGQWYALLLIGNFNVFDLVGRYTPLLKFLRIESRKVLIAAAVSRLIFLPAFYFTAKYSQEALMFVLVALLGLSNGHLTVCVMTVAPNGFKELEQNEVGNLLELFIQAGILSGVFFGWLWVFA